MIRKKCNRINDDDDYYYNLMLKEPTKYYHYRGLRPTVLTGTRIATPHCLADSTWLRLRKVSASYLRFYDFFFQKPNPNDFLTQ